MSNSDRYTIIFRGDIALDHNIVDVKRNLKKVFKASDARIDSLFTGKPVPLKRGLTLKEAQHYQHILLNMGAVSAIEPKVSIAPGQDDKQSNHDQSNSKHASATTRPETHARSAPSPVSQAWQLAPVGARLSDGSQATEDSIDVNIDHLALLPQQGYLLKEDERPPALTATIDLAALDWELTPYGELLLKASERTSANTTHIEAPPLSLTAPGEDLLKASEKKALEKSTVEGLIDTSYLRVVPDEGP